MHLYRMKQNTYMLLLFFNRNHNRVALWDVASTTLNYTGAALSGPTIFAIIYSSVTIWTACEFSATYIKCDLKHTTTTTTTSVPDTPNFESEFCVLL